MKKHLFAAALTAAALVAGSAQATTYKCEFKLQNDGHWLPDVVVLSHDEASGDVVVNSPMIQHFMGGPTEGKLSVDNNRRRTFQWTVKGISAGAQYASGIVVRMSVQKASHKAVVTSTIKGYVNNYRADGKCAVTK